MYKYLAVFLTIPVALAADARAVTINWSLVGNPGNAADPQVGSNHGAVGYSYSIDKYHVTNSQYAEFINAKDATGTDPLGLYGLGMGNATFGGITFNSGLPNGSKFTVISGRGNHPVMQVNWYSAIRFANWLNNGQGNGDTESGAYTLLGGTPIPSNGLSITRNVGATVFLPSEDEWYKAAFYDPRTTAQGGPPANNHYWFYPTGSNTAPIASLPTGLANHANYNNAVGNVTDVGAYAGTTSPYGAFDMGGNVHQWDEALVNSSQRGLRGGGFFDTVGSLGSSITGVVSSAPQDGGFVGFRVASVVPEPSALVLAALGFAGLAAWGWRRRS